ncbi:MAG: hypothetical protein WDA65_06225 [Christensenellales bacterium]
MGIIIVYNKLKEAQTMPPVAVKPIRTVVEVTDRECAEQIAKILMTKPTEEEIAKSRRCIYYAKNAKKPRTVS